MSAQSPPPSTVQLVSRSLVELALIASLVFATGWIGVHLAEFLHRRPVNANADGTIELPIVKSDRHGTVSFEEGFGYKGWWHCEGNDWEVAWRLVAQSRRYRVQIRVATPEVDGNGQIAVVIGRQSIEAPIPATGGIEKWTDLDLDNFHLQAGSCLLTIHPAASNRPARMNLKSVTLRPE